MGDRPTGPLWAALTGVGLGGSFPLTLTLPLGYADTPAEDGSLLAIILGLAMLASTAGPAAFGLLRDGFVAGMPFLVLAATTSLLLGMTFRPRPLLPAA